MEEKLQIAVIASEPEAQLAEKVKGLVSKSGEFQLVLDKRFADVVIAINPPYEFAQTEPRRIGCIVVTTVEDVDCVLAYVRSGADDVILYRPWKQNEYVFCQDLFGAIRRVTGRRS